MALTTDNRNCAQLCQQHLIIRINNDRNNQIYQIKAAANKNKKINIEIPKTDSNNN
jgi:hypothetical protein